MIGPETAAWATLARLAEEGAGADVAAAFKADPAREHRFTREAAGVLLDLSHQRIDQKIFDALIELAREVEIPCAFRAVFAGEKINTTEGRQSIADSYSIRRNALQHKIYCTTTIAAGQAVCEALKFGSEKTVRRLQDLHAGIKA